MTCGIYAIFSEADDTCLYVGQSQDAEARLRQHVSRLRRKSKKSLDSFIEWYHANGCDETKLRFELVEACADIDLLRNSLEAKWFHVLQPSFYGKAPSLKDTWQMTDEVRAAIANGVTKHYPLRDGQVYDSEGKRKYRLACASKECGKEFLRDKEQKFCSVSCRGAASAVPGLSQADLEKYLSAGLTMYEIADVVGCTALTVNNRLRALGLTVPVDRTQFTRLIASVDKETLVALYKDECFTIAALSQQFGVSGDVMSRALEHYEIPTRGRTRAKESSKT